MGRFCALGRLLAHTLPLPSLSHLNLVDTLSETEGVDGFGHVPQSAHKARVVQWRAGTEKKGRGFVKEKKLVDTPSPSHPQPVRSIMRHHQEETWACFDRPGVTFTVALCCLYRRPCVYLYVYTSRQICTPRGDVGKHDGFAVAAERRLKQVRELRLAEGDVLRLVGERLPCRYIPVTYVSFDCGRGRA